MRQLISVSLLVWLLAGCGTGGPPQDLAKRLAAYTAQIKTTDAGYARARDEIAAARRAVVEQITADAVAAEGRTALFLDVWRLAGDERRLKTIELLRKASVPVVLPTEVLPPTPAAAPDTAASAAAKARGQKLDDTAKTLGELAEPPSLTESLKFYGAFFQSVSDAVKKARDQEQQQVQAAEQDVTAKSKAAADTEHARATTKK